MKTCRSCKKKSVCKKPCPDVEQILRKGVRRMGNYYLIKTISPDKINDMNVGNEKYEYVYRYPKYGKFIDMLEKCVRSLNRNQRNCVIRYYGLYGNEDEVRSQPKIAVKLKVSQNTVKYHLQQARKCLKEQLNAKYIIYKKRK